MAELETNAARVIQVCTFETLIGLVKDGLLSINDSAVRADMSIEAFEGEIKKVSLSEADSAKPVK